VKFYVSALVGVIFKVIHIKMFSHKCLKSKQDEMYSAIALPPHVLVEWLGIPFLTCESQC